MSGGVVSAQSMKMGIAMLRRALLGAATCLLALGVSTGVAAQVNADAGYEYHYAAIIHNEGLYKSVSIERAIGAGWRCTDIARIGPGKVRTTSYKLYNNTSYVFRMYYVEGCSGNNRSYQNVTQSDSNKYWYIWA